MQLLTMSLLHLARENQSRLTPYGTMHFPSCTNGHTTYTVQGVPAMLLSLTRNRAYAANRAFRPNQLLALSLRYPILDSEYRSIVLNLITQHLLTPLGLRTLAPYEPGYRGHLPGNLEHLQRALHQGSVWPWLIGPYVDAWLNVHGSSSILTLSAVQDRQLQQEHLKRLQHEGLAILEPFRKQLSEGILGMIGSAFSGDAPHDGGYRVTSALSIGEILRVYNLFAQTDIGYSSQAFSIPTPTFRSVPGSRSVFAHFFHKLSTPSTK